MSDDHVHDEHCMTFALGSAEGIAIDLRNAGAPPAVIADVDQQAARSRDAIHELVERHIQIKVAERMGLPREFIGALSKSAVLESVKWGPELVLSVLHSLAATHARNVVDGLDDTGLMTFVAQRADDADNDLATLLNDVDDTESPPSS